MYSWTCTLYWCSTGGVAGAAIATVIAQYVSGLGITAYVYLRCRELLPEKRHRGFDRKTLSELLDLSLMTCVQQSTMNFGILMVQRLVDSFGPVTMAVFAYLPVQNFGNAFSTFIAQNFGAGKKDRLKQGFRTATVISALFSLVISCLVFVFAKQLMGLFIQKEEADVISCGIRYLRIEGAFYPGIGLLFLLYGFYRAVKKPGMSVVLTVISLGTRVLLAYALAGPIGEIGIWMAIPIGWFLADVTGYGYYWKQKANILRLDN